MIGSVTALVAAAARRACERFFSPMRQDCAHTPPRASGLPHLHLMELESRVMLSATPIGTLADGLDGGDLSGIDVSDMDLDLLDDSLLVDASDSTVSSAEQSEVAGIQEPPLVDAGESAEVRHELVIIDTSADDYEEFVNDILAQQDSGREIEVVLLDADRDGVEQISSILSDRDGLDAVHIVSHGTDGSVKLGDSWLDSEQLEANSSQISGWKDAFAEDGDLLFYGCDLASTVEGRSLIDSLGALCDCDVAASTDDTGLAERGGDWDLEYAIGQVETDVVFSSQLQENWDGLLAPSTAGTAIYRSSGSTEPVTNFYDGISFGADVDSATVGEWRVIQGAEAPTRDEIIVLGVNTSGTINGQMWDGSSWSTLSLNPLGSVSESYWWSMDVQYESQSGDALAVWADGASIEYATWDGSSWSSVNAISTLVYTGATPRQMQLASAPDSDEMVLVVSDSSSEDFAMVWDGSSWGDEVTLSSTSTDDRTDIFVEYEQQSGDALVVYGDSDINPRYRIWDGSNWSTEATVTAAVGVTGDVRWATLDADPNSDRIALGAQTFGSESWFAVWDGSAWGNQVVGTTTATTAIAPNMAVAFESNSGALLATYAEDDTGIRYQTWTSGGGWSGENVGTDIGGDPATMMLSSDPNGDQIMLSVIEDNSDVHYVMWDGGDWTSDNELESNTGETKNQPFLFLFDQGTHFDTSGDALWLSTDGDDSSPDVDGVNELYKSEAFRFGDPSLTFDPSGGVTDGNFSHVFNLDDYADDSDANLDSLHYVTRNITVGSGLNTYDLQPGDILFTTKDNEDLTSSNSISFENDEVAVFRPDTAGDYSSGSFTLLLDEFDTIHGGGKTFAISLVEEETVVGDATLAAGDFLFVRDGGDEDSDVMVFSPTGVGAGSTTGSVATLIDGDDIDISPKLWGLELIENDTTIGGTTLNAGQILVTVDGNDSSFADNGIAVSENDVIALTVTNTTLIAGAGNTAVDATLILDGSDVSLDSGAEKLDALTLYSTGIDPAITLPGAAVNFTEGDGATIIDATATVSDPDSSDFDTGTLTVDFSANGTANDRLAINDEGTGIGEIGVSGSDVTYEGTVIGTFTGGTDGSTPLVITLDDDATVAATQALVRNITYDNVSEVPSISARTVRFVLTDGDGQTSNAVSQTINVAAENDAPVATIIPIAYGVDEDNVPVTLSGLDISDVDAGANDVEVTISVTDGDLTLVTTTGLTFTGGANGTSTMTVTGTLADINTALDSLRYQPDADFNGTDTFTLAINDQGNSGGAAESDSDTANILVSAVNDAPVNSVPSSQTTAVDTPVTFNTANGNLISISDVDAGSGSLLVSLSTVNGTNTLSGITGLSFSTGNGTDDASMVFTGTLANINAALDGMVFTPTASYVGGASIGLKVDDQGNSGGSAEADADVISINVAATTFQEGTSGYTGNEDTELQEDNPNTDLGSSTSISIDLVNVSDESQGLIRFDNIFGSGAGQIPFGSTINSASLTVHVFDTSDSSATISLHRMLATWTESSTWNSLTNGLQLNDVEVSSTIDSTMTLAEFTGPQTFYGLETTVQAWSDGSSNEGWAIVTDSNDGWDFYSSEYATVDRRPILTIDFTAPQLPTLDLDLNDSSGASGNNFDASFTEGAGAVAIADIDTTIADPDGTQITRADIVLTNAQTGDVLSVSGSLPTGISLDGASTSSNLILTGSATLADYETAIEQLRFNNTSDTPNTTDRTITVQVTDGSAQASSLATTTVSVAADNDAPVNTVPGTQTVNEETATAISGLSISDVDAGSGTLTTRLQVSDGALNVTLSGTATISAGTNGSDDLTISGTVADINGTLASLTYTGNTDVTGTAADTLTVTTNDGGNTGGPAEQDVDTVQIDIMAVNDPPINAVPGTQTVSEETATAIGGLSISDADAGSGTVTTRLQVTNGVLNVTLSGSASISAGANGSNDLTISGTVTDINGTLSSLSYTGDTDVIGTAADSLTVTTNDGGNTGGPAEQDVDTVQIDITAANDPPVNTVPGPQTVDEETATAIGGLSISDVDAGSGTLTTRLQVSDGALNVTLSGTATISAGTNGSGDLTISGTVADINGTLASLTYTGNTDITGTAADTLTITTNDGGNTGGPAEQDVDTVQINIAAINDAPVVTAPSSALNATEQTNLTVEGVGFGVTDVDEADAGATATLDVGEGNLTVVIGDSGVAITGGNNSGSVDLSGTIAQINALLDGTSTGTITYFNNSDTPSTNTTFTVTVNDGGNTGSDPGSSGTPTTEEGSNSVTINIAATNDDPTNAGTLPTDLTVNEDTSSNVDLSAIDLSDPDAATGSLTVILTTSTGGNLSATTGGGVTVGGSGSGILTLDGTQANLNTFLNTASNITYLHGTPGTSGDDADTIQVDVTDNNNSGSGGGSTITLGTVNVDITPMNDAPINTVPGTQTVMEEATTAIAGLSISDADAGSGNLTTRLQVSDGVLNVTLSGSASISSGTNGSADLTISGTVTDINATLASLTYTGNTDVVGTAADTLTVTTNDGGNTGGPAEQDIDTVQIDITPINDAPDITAPGSQTIDQDSSLTFSSGGGNAIVVVDVDSGGSSVEITLTSTNGVISLADISGLTFTIGDGSADPTVQAQGTVTAVNAALDGLVFVPTSGFFGSATLDIQVDDLGNTGPSSESDSETIGITVNEVSDDDPIAPPPDGEETEPETEEEETEEELTDGPPPAEPSPPTSTTSTSKTAPIQTVSFTTSGKQPLAANSVQQLALPEASRDFGNPNGSPGAAIPSPNVGAFEAVPLIVHASPPDSLQLVEDIAALGEQLDEFRKELVQQTSFDTLVVGSASTFSTVFSVGYALWTVRGGYFMATLLSSMPAWQVLDPLPVLSAVLGPDETEPGEKKRRDESLQDMVSRKKDPPQTSDERLQTFHTSTTKQPGHVSE